MVQLTVLSRFAFSTLSALYGRMAQQRGMSLVSATTWTLNLHLDHGHKELSSRLQDSAGPLAIILTMASGGFRSLQLRSG